MPLYKDYYKCLSIVENTKKNGEDYLYLKLQNKNTIIDGYLWSNTEFYRKKIINNQIYAIKYELDRYNNLEVLNIKNINPVLNDNYRRYGYNPSMVKMSLTKKKQFDFDQILKFIEGYNDVSFDFLKIHIISNKSKYLKFGKLEYKLFILRYLKLIEQTTNKTLDVLYPFIVLLEDMDLDINQLLSNLKDVNGVLYEELSLYDKKNKAFIKKYKIIVDLINASKDNYRKFKNGVK